jgi:hypothetical protein
MVRVPTPLCFLTLVARVQADSLPRFDMAEEKERCDGLIGGETHLCLEPHH